MGLLHEQLEITADQTAPEASILERTTARLAEKLKERTGLTPQEVEVEGLGFSVTATVLGKSKKFGRGKSEDRPVTGTSNESFQEALDKAVGKNKYNRELIDLTLYQRVKAPYQTVSLTARALSEEEVMRQLEARSGSLIERYAERVVRAPDSVSYRVTHTTADYAKAGRIPDTLSRNKIVSAAGSNMSLEAAKKEAETTQPYKCTVFEATWDMKIYGSEAIHASVAEEQLALPAFSEANAARAVKSTPGESTGSTESVGAAPVGSISDIGMAAAAASSSGARSGSGSGHQQRIHHQGSRGRTYAPGSPAGEMPYSMPASTRLV